MKWLVTGAYGFIGTHLCQTLHRLGHTLLCVDDLSTTTQIPVFFPPHQRILTGVEKLYPQDSLFSGIDGIFHLAGRPGLDLIESEGSNCILQPIRMMEAVIRIASFRKIPVLFTSSSEVYGFASKPGVQLKESDPVGPFDVNFKRAEYAIGKFSAERLLVNHNIKHASVRLFNIIGRGQKSSGGHVIPSFVENALANKPLIVYGTGYHRRTWQDVRETVRIFCDLMATLQVHNLSIGPVNVGSGNPRNDLNVKSMAKLIIALSESKSKILYEDTPWHRRSDPISRVPNLTRMMVHTVPNPEPPRIEDTLNWIIEGSRTGTV